MVKREQRKPLFDGETRRIADQIPDNPDDPRTWSEEQRWDGIPVGYFDREVRRADNATLRAMRAYFVRIRDAEKRRIVEREQARRLG